MRDDGRIRLGLSTFVLESPFSDDDLGVMDTVRGYGYDQIEVCIEDPTRLSADKVARAAVNSGLEVLVCGAFGPQRDVSAEEPERRQGGLDYLDHCVEFAAAVGSPWVSGPMYATTGQARLLEPQQRAAQWSRAIASLQQVAANAASSGISLAIEPLNRFETDLVNTVEQGVRLSEDIGAPNVGLMLDTFHMNIEERDLPTAIRAAGDHVFHFQASENDRGTPGSGHTDWVGVATALRDIGYQGSVVVESFIPTVQEIARAVSLWRPVAESMEALAADAARFLRPLFDTADASPASRKKG